ncbi:MAG: winged helix-turn-helix domain-containing protein [Thermoanaerobaculia bacterium]|nr:winged helix-turn-helix domain-containing protein [Thermoanaerobaculia bacterium]
MSREDAAEKGRPFEIGPWRVEPGLDRIRRGSDSVALEPRAMDLLVFLARHAGETVSKETLLQEVWKGAFVVEGVIPKTLSALRAALGDDASHPTFVLTVPRRGYRLVAPVRWLEEPPGGDPGPAGAELLAAGGAAEISERRAVPPVEGDKPALAGSPRWLPADRRRRLISMTLGLAVAGTLGWLVLASGEHPLFAPSRSAPPVPDAVERLVLEARNLWAQRGVESVRRATELMQEAVKEAPASAEAHAWLALSLMTRASYLGGGEAACAQAAEQARLAIGLDPDDPIALCAAGFLALQVDFDARRAIANLERSVALDPKFVPARQFLAEALTIAGEHERALAEIDQALALEPLSALLYGVRGNILLRADRPLAALEAYERVLVLEPKFTWVYRNRARPLVQLGREQEALESLYSERRLTNERPEHLATLRAAIDREGFEGYWRWRLERYAALRAQGIEPRSFPLAEALAGAGEPEAALAELARSAVCPDVDTFLYGRESPAFDSLRHDPRFVAIYARFGL